MKMFQRLAKWTPLPLRQQQRNFQTTPKIRGGDDHHDVGGIPGKNLPFDISNRWLLALKMGLYMGSGFATPFLLMRFHLKKKSDA